ncbi:hypothetical protein F4678DRAFT_465979 [Xylaria arbuscula]|nr:hypothetical protein F4678DRAFT_465979 [Xylaria arbuscula]
MSGHNPSPALRDCTGDIAVSGSEAASLLLPTSNANSLQSKPHENARKRSRTRPSAALVEAVAIWRERVRNAPSTYDMLDTSDRMGGSSVLSCQRTELTKEGSTILRLNRTGGQYICPASLRRTFPVRSELRSYMPSSSGSIPSLYSVSGPTYPSTSNEPISLTRAEYNIAADETIKTIRTLPPKSRVASDAALAMQCATIKGLVKQGDHLAALTHALRYSSRFTFEGNINEFFSACIHIFNFDKKKEVLGIMMRFRKPLNLGFKRFLARRLLNGVLIRYPKGFFPRTFCVAEGDRKQSVLQTCEAADNFCHTFERGNHCRDLIVQQWRWGRRCQ